MAKSAVRPAVGGHQTPKRPLWSQHNRECPFCIGHSLPPDLQEEFRRRQVELTGMLHDCTPVRRALTRATASVATASHERATLQLDCPQSLRPALPGMEWQMTCENPKKIHLESALRRGSVAAGNEHLERVIARIAKLESSTADAQYAKGHQFNAVRENPEKYGVSTVKAAQAAITARTGVEKTTLYAAADVAAKWDRASFRAWLRKKSAGGWTLSFAHFVAISGRDIGDADWLLEIALEERLSSRDLARFVGSMFDEEASARNQRHRSLVKFIARAEEHSAEWFDGDGRLALNSALVGVDRDELRRDVEHAAEVFNRLAQQYANAKAMLAEAGGTSLGPDHRERLTAPSVIVALPTATPVLSESATEQLRGEA